MLPRRGVLKKFSTFIQFADDRFEQWAEEPRLARSMRKKRALLEADQLASGQPESEPPEGEHFWTIHWHQCWRKQPQGIALGHLYAYLQEPCYWTAQKLSQRFNTVQFSLSDCFQAALSRLDKVLHGFKPELGVALSTYAGSAFANAIRDALSQYSEVQICSDWSLLRRVTRKRWREALRAAGFDKATLEIYEVAWISFREVCFPAQKTVRRLSQLTLADWEAIAQTYEHFRQTQITLPPTSPEEIKTWLSEGAQHLRRYMSPTALSLNTGVEEADEWLEQVTGPEEPMVDLIAQEEAQTRQLRQQEMARILSQALAKLDGPTREVLELYYRDQLKQKEIAAKLDTQQYSISRRLSKARRLLLADLVQWSRSELHISLDSTVLNIISAFLEDWLQIWFSGDRTEDASA